MAEKSISCSAATRAQADQIIDRLKKADFSGDDISVQFPDRAAFKNAPPVKKKKFTGSMGAFIGAGLCGVVGLVFGRFAGVGALNIPGTASMVAAGPLMAA